MNFSMVSCAIDSRRTAAHGLAGSIVQHLHTSQCRMLDSSWTLQSRRIRQCSLASMFPLHSHDSADACGLSQFSQQPHEGRHEQRQRTHWNCLIAVC